MDNEILGIMNALKNNEIHVVNQFLKEKWDQDVNLFIESVALLRNENPSLVDKHFNSREFLQQFTRH